MTYPLAHDEHGIPLDIPTGTSGWLVRRHGGGRGRPAAVYDPDGRPLVVDLDATVADLRNAGCKPGSYRLDAVDGQRKLLGAAAYTELQGTGDPGDVETTGSDAAVMALARAVEAMQRVQAERERMQSEMFAKLIDRLTPPAPAQPQGLLDALGEYTDAQKLIRNLAPEPAEEADEAGGSDGLTKLATVLEQIAAGLLSVPAVKQKLGLNPTAAETEADEDEDQGDEDEPAKSRAEKLADVVALLTPEEADTLDRMTTQIPPAMLQRAIDDLIAMPPEAAAAEIRKRLKGQTQQAEKATQKGAA